MSLKIMTISQKSKKLCVGHRYWVGWIPTVGNNYLGKNGTHTYAQVHFFLLVCSVVVTSKIVALRLVKSLGPHLLSCSVSAWDVAVRLVKSLRPTLTLMLCVRLRCCCCFSVAVIIVCFSLSLFDNGFNGRFGAREIKYYITVRFYCSRY